MTKVDDIIKQVDRLRPVSQVGTKVAEITSNPNSSLDQIVDIIKYDQSITANLLRTCNSSYFGLKKKITSIKQAVAYLGLNKVANLVVMEDNAENFKQEQKGYDLEQGELWRYSVSSALIAQNLAEKKSLKDISLIFTSALLKDIGKVILNTYVRDSIEEINRLVQHERMTFKDAEKQVIGIDHADLGARVAENWNFSSRMVFLIRNHHDPEMAAEDDLILPVIYLADSICMMMGIGVGSDGLAYKYYQEILDRLNFSAVDLQIAIAEFWESLKGVEELVNLSGGS